MGISGLRNFWIQKQVTSKEDEGEDESDEWKGNSSGDSNLNSGILATEYKCL